jgi:hypothetical protein
MLTNHKNNEKKQIDYFDSYLIPVTAIAFPKKLDIKKKESKGSAIDFHLEIIKKIDKILDKDQSKKNISDLILEKTINNNQEDSFVEIRSSLNKGIIYPEYKPDIKQNHFYPKIDSSTEITPENSNTDYPKVDHRTKENIRIEIIDIGSKSIQNESKKKMLIFSTNKFQKIKNKSDKKTKQKIKSLDLKNKKVEVINTKKLSNKKSGKLWNNILKKPNKNENKAKLFYINSQEQQKEKKSEEPSSDKLYIPNDFGKKLQNFKESDKIEMERRKKKDAKRKQKEESKLKKLEAKKALLEAKEKEKLAKIAEKEKKKNLIRDEDTNRSKNKETNNHKSISSKKSTSEVEKLTEWESYDTEIENTKKDIEIKENVRGKKLLKEQEKQQILIEKKKLSELKQQKKEMRIKEKEDKKNKKLVAKKAIKEEKEKEKIARIEEKKKKKNQQSEEKKKKEQEQELKTANKNLRKNQERQNKEKKLIKLFKKEKRKPVDNRVSIVSNHKNLEEEKQINEITENIGTEEFKEKTNETEQTFLDEDIKKLLIITDDLLAKLPEEVIDEFANSEDFKLYSKVFNKYKLK